MQRREFLTLLGSAMVGAPRIGVAQMSKVYHLGTLTVGPPICHSRFRRATCLRST